MKNNRYKKILNEKSKKAVNLRKSRKCKKQ